MRAHYLKIGCRGYGLEGIIRLFSLVVIVTAGLFGLGEKMGMEIVHHNIREQRRFGEIARVVESQKRRAVGVPDHDQTIGIRKGSQVN